MGERRILRFQSRRVRLFDRGPVLCTLTLTDGTAGPRRRVGRVPPRRLLLCDGHLSGIRLPQSALDGRHCALEGVAMNVLVTGAAGFIGSHLTRLMLSEGHAVTAVLSSSTPTGRIHDLLPRLAIIACDVRDRLEIQRRLSDAPPDVCIHLAWRGWSGPSLAAEENLTSLAGSLEFLRAMADIGCPRFVGVGTCFEYEPQSAPMAEVTATLPRDLYGVCKHALSVAAQKTADITRMQVAWARVFLVYGPHDDERRLVPSVALALIRGEVAKTTLGEQVRDVLHVGRRVSHLG